MHVVVIHHKHEVTPEKVQALAAALGVTAFDARQRLSCPCPVVVSTQADRQQAELTRQQLQESGFETFVVDVHAALNERPVFIVRSFAFQDDCLRVCDSENRTVSIAYKEIRLMLPSSRTLLQAEVQTVTERKFSVGKSLMAGGIPMTKKVTRKETVSEENREQALYLCNKNRARVVCSQNTMSYQGFANAMKPSREMNYTLFVSKMRHRSPAAVYDDRLMKRAEQVKLLGPMLDPDLYLDLAVDILATSVGTRN